MTHQGYADRADPRDQEITRWVMVALFAAGSAGLGWLLGWPLVVDMDDPEFNPLVILLGLGLLGGGWNLWQALRWRARSRRFGATRMDLDGPVPVPMGRVVAGRLRVDRPVGATGDYSLVLTCYDLHETSDTSKGGGRRTEAFPVWSKELVLTAGTDATKGLPFRFDLPASVGPKVRDPMDRPAGSPYVRGSLFITLPGFRRAITRGTAPVGRYWRLRVRAPVRGGGDYQAELVVPVTGD
jgi:hypothetical protein